MGDGYPILERVFDATIAISQSLSDVVDLQGYTLTAIYMPAVWTTANLTLQSDPPIAAEGTFQNVFDAAGTEKTITADADQYILLDPTEFIGLRRVKVRSGTSGTAVNQAAAAVVKLIGRPL